MSEDPSPYLYAWITEFSVAAPDATDILTDLSLGASTIHESQCPRSTPQKEFDHCILATLGTTDLIEIAFFNHLYHFFEIAESSSRSSKRSVGTRCLTAAELENLTTESRDYNLVPIDQLTLENARLPLIAIMSLRLSSLAKICVGSDDTTCPESATLLDAFLRRSFHRRNNSATQDGSTWNLYRSILTSTLDEPGSTSTPKLLITPLSGLDSVDFIFLVRARNLEQIAALALAMRLQKLGTIWPTTSTGPDPKYLKTAKELLGYSNTIALDWNRTALFKEIKTNWGLRVMKSKESGDWRLERYRDAETQIAKAAVSFSLTRVAPDRIRASMKPFGIINSLQQRGKVQIDTARRSLVLFGEFDTLLTPSVEDLFRTVTLLDLQNHFRYLTGVESRYLTGVEPERQSALEAGIWPSTEIAVWIRMPVGIKRPTYKLMKRFRQRLHNRRVRDFGRLGERLSMTKRWLTGAQRLGLPYSTTSTMVNLLPAFLSSLEREPERFSELLPAIRYLIDIVALHDAPLEPKATSPEPTQADIRWLLSRTKEAFETLTHDHYPLQSSNITLRAEGAAGHRIANDAFYCMAESLNSALAHSHRIIVLPTVGGGLTSESGPRNLTVLRASSFVLHYPISWLIASELTHRRLQSTHLSDLPSEEQRSLHKLLVKADCDLDDRTLVIEALGALGGAFDSSASHSPSRVFTSSFSRILGEIIADLTLWRSLCIDSDDGAEGIRRLWFIHGPALVSAKRDSCGSRSLGLPRLSDLILRVFFSNFLADSHPAQPGETSKPHAAPWHKPFLVLLNDLKNNQLRLENYHTLELDYHARSYMHLQCLRLDLGIPDAMWSTAIDSMSWSFSDVNNNKSRAASLIHQSLVLAKSMVDFWLWQESTEHPGRRLFCRYLSRLISDWETSDPWPPFIRSHSVELNVSRGSMANVSVARERLRSSDPKGGFISIRGGVFLRGNCSSLALEDNYAADLEAQKAYHIKTGTLIKRLADCSRTIRTRHLRDFLLPT